MSEADIERRDHDARIVPIWVTVSIAGALLLFAHSSSAADGISISGSWARDTPPGVTNGAVYLRIENAGNTADRLTGVSSDVSRTSEIHRHVSENGVLKMREVDAVDIPVGGAVAFEPGGDHVMLIGLDRTLNRGDSILLTLEFADAGVILVSVPVMRSAP